MLSKLMCFSVLSLITIEAQANPPMLKNDSNRPGGRAAQKPMR